MQNFTPNLDQLHSFFLRIIWTCVCRIYQKISSSPLFEKWQIGPHCGVVITFSRYLYVNNMI